VKALAQPDVKAQFDTLGLEAVGMRPAAFAKFVAKESEATLAVARRIGAAKK
jgi:tripartite-type tricarboxylate transporter receptor subunit TctC